MLEKLNKIIREYKGDITINITPNMIIKEDLGMSSFDLIQLVCEIEDEFNVEILDGSIRDFKTISDIINFLES